MVKRLWPLAAFAVAACLVAGFVSFQRKAADAQSPERLRSERRKELLNQAAQYAHDQSFPKTLDALEQITTEYAGEYNPSLDLDAADACLKVRPPRPDRALEHLDAFVKSSPQYAGFGRVHRIRGEAAFDKGDFRTARDRFQKYYESLEPGVEDYHVLSMMAGCFLELGDEPRAEKNWRKVADESGDYREPDEARYNLGVINQARYERFNNPQYANDALADFKYVVDDLVNPDLRYGARVRSAEILLALGEYDKAGEAYLSALEVVPSVPDMVRILKSGDATASRDEVLQLQVLGVPQMIKEHGQQVPATKLQKVVQYDVDCREEDRLPEAIDTLERAAAALDKKQVIYLQIAGLYDKLIDITKAEIAALEGRLSEFGSGMNDRLKTEAAYRLEQELKAKQDLLSEYLKASASYYESGFNEDPYRAGETDYREHPLWKAAQRLLERRDYAGAERVLLRVLDHVLKISDKVMLGETRLCLGRLYRDSGRYDDALRMFRAITQDRPDPSNVGNMDFLGWAAFEEAVTLAKMGDEAAAAKGFEDIMRDDNPMGWSRASKIWRASTIELAKLRYSEAVNATGPERVGKFTALVEYLAEAMDRYAAFLEDEPDTRNLLLYYTGDSLHHLALAAVSRGENQKARENFEQAREYLSKMTEMNGSAESMPVFYRNSRLLIAQTLQFESGIAPDDAMKQALAGEAMKQYDEASKSLENTEQGIWALIQLGAMADASGDPAVKAGAKRYYDLAESGIKRLKESGVLDGNPQGFDAAYIQDVLRWLAGRAGN
jgi:tetratricopeptide (TPR) repeat protein